MQRDKRLCVFICEQQGDLTIVFLGNFLTWRLNSDWYKNDRS